MNLLIVAFHEDDPAYDVPAMITKHANPLSPLRQQPRLGTQDHRAGARVLRGARSGVQRRDDRAAVETGHVVVDDDEVAVDEVTRVADDVPNAREMALLPYSGSGR